MRSLAVLALVALLAAGCAARRPAPVSERTPMPPEQAIAPPAPAAEPAPPPVEKPVPTHTVKKGETLVGIALQYGLDYRELAAWNNIVNPAAIKVGQVLVIAPPPGAPLATPLAPATPAPKGPGGAVATPLVTAGPPIEGRPLANTDATKVEPRAQKLPFSERALAQLSAGDATTPPDASSPVPSPPSSPVPPARAPGTDSDNVDWTWPVKGKVIAPFTESSKGVDIAGKKGTAVRAAAAGRVIYADHGLRGLGNLIIIRHNDAWLSAYAHNDKLMVKEQDEVKKGQKIAEMGASDADQVKLHFEVRRQGKPVDPLKLLPPQ